MRLLILIVVVVAHIALVLCLVRPQAPSPALPDRDPAAAADREAGGKPSKPSPDDDARNLRFDAASWRRPQVALPSKLAAKTGRCRSGVLLDWGNNTVLWSKNDRSLAPIASLTKMMTALVFMEIVEQDPELRLDTPVKVTRSAWRIGGSEVYLDPRETFTLDELLKCVMIRSANDAAHLIAEFLGKGEPARFVGRMNAKARELGLEGLSFHNAHGLPDRKTGKENQGAAIELAYLAGLLLEHPEVVRWSSTPLDYVRKRSQAPVKLADRQLTNHNPLVKTCPGVNGMKTGFTNRAGFCLAATCERQKRVLIAVVTGCSTKQARNDLVAALLDWGYTTPNSRSE